jgi:guanylate kinase
MKNKTGLLMVLSGPSGSGKGTVVRRLLDGQSDTMLSVSATTRSPRPGEQDGVHYFFFTRERFEQMIAENAFLEYAEYNGNYYGTPKAPVEAWLAQGKNVLLEIEVQGTEQVMHTGVPLVSLFVTVPSMAELERRLRGRGTEDDACVRRRLQTAVGELKKAYLYDYVIMNDEVERAVARIRTVMDAERMRYARMENSITEVLKDAETY